MHLVVLEVNEMSDTKTARTMCRKCKENPVCDIRQVILFYQPIQQDHPDPNYTLENIFKAGAGECPFYRVNDEEDE